MSARPAGPAWPVLQPHADRRRQDAVAVSERGAGRFGPGQVVAGREFHKQLETYWQGCELWGDTQLEASDTALAFGSMLQPRFGF